MVAGEVVVEPNSVKESVEADLVAQFMDVEENVAKAKVIAVTV